MVSTMNVPDLGSGHYLRQGPGGQWNSENCLYSKLAPSKYLNPIVFQKE